MTEGRNLVGMFRAGEAETQYEKDVNIVIFAATINKKRDSEEELKSFYDKRCAQWENDVTFDDFISDVNERIEKNYPQVEIPHS